MQIFDIDLIKDVTLNVDCIRSVHCLCKDYHPYLLIMGFPVGGHPNPNINITTINKKGVTFSLEKIDTLASNSISDDITTIDKIGADIRTLIKHIKTVASNNLWVVPATSDCRKLLANALEILRVKNAALCGANAYVTAKNMSRARVLRHRVRVHMKKFRNGIPPTHKAFLQVSEAIKSEEYNTTPL
ncbi:hypothetical protein EVAR_102766_1 [Eumeta japonica]|uniref:Uncharacterized protein n=1 Tax=Eumeta variegata TaxID=151549 RepID=A0A4C1THT1_EUMVA|nr:hypothetical protein EVAR_102766_1 [Eumeta japonica]